MTIPGEINQDKPQKDAKTSGNTQKRTGPRPPKRITAKYLHNAGLAYLQRFPASTHHFRRVMGRKITKSCKYHTDQDPQACTELLEPVIENFQQLGLLDDAAYLRGMVTSLRGRGLSRQAITAKLTLKGFKTDQIIQQVEHYDHESHDEEDGELKAALKLARRKKIGPFRQTQTPDDALRQKELAKLARAGFSYDISSRIIDMPAGEFK